MRPLRPGPAPVRAFILAMVAFLAGCANPPPPRAETPGAAPSRPVQAVSTVIVANGCANLGRANAKLAERAMDNLVEGCAHIPGGSVRFSATLLPTGRIAIAPGEGQPDVLPLCVLKHDLTHRVPLAKACVLNVRLEETTLRVPIAADAAAD
jgi:hypothetical protein